VSVRSDTSGFAFLPSLQTSAVTSGIYNTYGRHVCVTAHAPYRKFDKLKKKFLY